MAPLPENAISRLEVIGHEHLSVTNHPRCPADSPDSRIRHPRMPVADRAKIFAPFAALTGFEKVIEAENAKASTP